MLNEKLALNYGLDETTKKNLLEAWKPYTKVVKEFQPDVPEYELVNLAIVLENTKREMKRTEERIKRSGLLEATQVTDIGGFKRFAFEIITGVLPNLVANDIVSVQSLKQKVGQIFYLQYTYGSTKGDIKAGDIMYDPFTTVNDKAHYTSEVVEQEMIAPEVETTGNVVAANGTVGTISWLPIRPGTVHLTSKIGSTPVEWVDKGDGKLYLKDSSTQKGTIDYATGAVKVLADTTFVEAVYVSYAYNLEHAPAAAPEINLQIKEWLVTARSRKLRARYSFDAAYDIQQQHGIDIEAELAEHAVAEIRHEIDLEIINDLVNGAALTSSWNQAKPVGISQVEHYQSFVNEIIAAANKIFAETKRAVGNFVIVGKTGADVLEALPDTFYKAIEATDAVGPHVSGSLKNRFKIIKNPHFLDNQYLVGYKGKSWIDAGYVYAPYLPVFTTQMIMLDDFLARQGFATSYAKKLINPKFYVKGTITNVPETITTDGSSKVTVVGVSDGVNFPSQVTVVGVSDGVYFPQAAPDDDEGTPPAGGEG